MKRTWLILAGVLAVLLICALIFQDAWLARSPGGEEDRAATSNAVLLRYKFEGQELRYKTILELRFGSPALGDMTIRETSTEAHVLTKTPDGERYVAVTIENVDTETTMFDKLKEMGIDAPDVGAASKPWEGVTYRIYMTERGRTGRFERKDGALWKAMSFKANPMKAKVLQKEFSDEAMTAMMELMPSALLPEEAVEPGARWTNRRTTKAAMGDGDIDIEANTHLRKIETVTGSRVAVIGFEMTWTGEIGMTGTKTRSDGKGSGEMRFDLDLGAIRYEHLVFEMTLPDGRTMTSDMKTELQE